MTSLIACCAAQAFSIMATRFSPMPVTSIRREHDVLNDVERLQAEVRHDAPGRHRADALDQPAAQVLLQPGECCRFGFLRMETLELPSVLEMLAPVPGEAQRLARMNVWKAAHDGDEVAFPRCFEPGDGVAGVFGVIGDALDDTLQVFCGGVGARLVGSPGDVDTEKGPSLFSQRV